ncbi:hypothetical protein LAZ67_3003451 [Cordylochernes scorpioides]|uniref:Uncharacterized protein n=1 Tax=Cordylochernes scorpioides TaxID=51811 RepID=A0ABY6KBE3_9ARAC|nr:hypothetical protein LAZ67_3003451 [Cordylochernes scorpioides]
MKAYPYQEHIGNVETKRAYPADNEVNRLDKRRQTSDDVRAYPAYMRSTVASTRRQTYGYVTLEHIKRGCPAAKVVSQFSRCQIADSSSRDGWLRHTSRAFQIAVSSQVKFDEICPAPSLILMFVSSCSIMLIPAPPLLRVRSEDPSVYAVEGRGLAILIKNLYYEDIAVNITNTLDLEAQGIKVYLNQNKAIHIYNMYHPPNNTFIDDGTMAQFLTDNTIIVALIIFSMKKINMKELAYALENTDLNNTPGPDGIHGRMISNLGKIGKERLLNIFNNSWKTGKLPQDCKNATIIPI